MEISIKISKRFSQPPNIWRWIRIFGSFLFLSGFIHSQSNPPSQLIHNMNNPPTKERTTEFKRIVSLNGSLSEIVYSLGKGSILVGTDTTSYFPPEIAKLPKVGYQRSLSLEGILSLKPDLVLGTEDAGPPEVLEKLKKLGVRLEIHSMKPGLESCVSRIRFVGKILGVNSEADSLIQRITTKAHSIRNFPPWKIKPKVLMIYSRGKNTILVAGKETNGSAMIELVGAENYVSEFTGYKPLTPEILLKNKLDVVLITDMSIKELGGEEEFWKLPGFRVLNQKARPALVSMDDLLLLGFSDRLDSALEELQSRIAKSIK